MFYLKKAFWLFLPSFYDYFLCPDPPLCKSGVIFSPIDCIYTYTWYAPAPQTSCARQWLTTFNHICEILWLGTFAFALKKNVLQEKRIFCLTCNQKKKKKSVQEVCAAPPQSAAVLARGGGVFKKLLPPLISTHLSPSCSASSPLRRRLLRGNLWATVSRFRCRDTPALWRHFRGGGDAEETPAYAGTSRAVPTGCVTARHLFKCCFLLYLFSERWRFSLPVSSRRQVARSSLQPRLWDYVTEVWAVCPARAQKKKEQQPHSLL